MTKRTLKKGCDMKMIKLWISRNDLDDSQMTDWLIVSRHRPVGISWHGYWELDCDPVEFITVNGFVRGWDYNFPLPKKGCQVQVWFYENEVQI